MKNVKTLNIVRVICYLFFLAPLIFWVFDSYGAGVINWPIITLTVLVLLQIIFRINKADFILSIILAMGSFYMLLAVSSDLADHFNKTKPVRNFGEYFGFGYGIFGTAFVAALIILYCYFSRKSILENRKALQL